MSNHDDDTFEERKRRSFLQVLFKTARVTNDLAIERVREATGDERIRAAHTSLFPHISSEGVRLTTLAERVGVTKQAVQQLVDDMEEFGAVERVPDPRDGRAKLIRWTAEGRDGLDFGLGMLVELEGELAEVVGEDELRGAHLVLLRLLDYVEAGKLGGSEAAECMNAERGISEDNADAREKR
jgi:DNA-binding MarR family transcriptional regulator